MRKIKLLPALLLAVLFSSTPLRAQDKIEIFGGFSYARIPVQVFTPIAVTGPVIVIPPGTCPVTGCPPGIGGFSTDHVNTHGWEFSGAFKPIDWLGAVADFSGHYGSTHGSNLHLNTYLFGPQVLSLIHI